MWCSSWSTSRSEDSKICIFFFQSLCGKNLTTILNEYVAMKTKGKSLGWDSFKNLCVYLLWTSLRKRVVSSPRFGLWATPIYAWSSRFPCYADYQLEQHRVSKLSFFAVSSLSILVSNLNKARKYNEVFRIWKITFVKLNGLLWDK